jgi:hypothetical protein
MRGRTRHKVAGAGFEAWLDSTQVHMAALGDINEDNSTTLPYDPEPQYPSDMWDHDSTIQPGEQEIDADGLLATCLQHEMDHLNGVLFIDRMNSAAKAGLSGWLKRLQREE